MEEDGRPSGRQRINYEAPLLDLENYAQEMVWYKGIEGGNVLKSQPEVPEKT